MPQETYTPAQAAKQADIPLSTLRLWTGIYAEFLSPAANPGAGVNRRLTPQDVEVLKAVAQLRHNGLEPAQITARLRDTPLESLQQPPGTPTTGVEPMPGTSIAATSSNALEAFLSANTRQLDDVARRVETVDDRLKRVESTRWWIVAVLVAFAAGAGFVAAIVLLLR